MKGDRIAYYKGIKYVLATTYFVQLDFKPDYNIQTEYVDFNTDGWLTVRAGFPYDGPSGPTIDTPDSMRGALVHDALADLFRQGYLDRERHFTPMNKEFHKILLEDGMSPTRAEAWFIGVNDISDGKWAKYGTDGGRKLCFAP